MKTVFLRIFWAGSFGLALSATAAQDPLRMAKEGVATGHEIKQGKAPQEKTILIPVELITRDNVKNYKGWVTK